MYVHYPRPTCSRAAREGDRVRIIAPPNRTDHSVGTRLRPSRPPRRPGRRLHRLGPPRAAGPRLCAVGRAPPAGRVVRIDRAGDRLRDLRDVPPARRRSGRDRVADDGDRPGAAVRAGHRRHTSPAPRVLALLVGAVHLVLRFGRLGFVVNFLSHSVLVGFTAASAIIIVASQIKHVLGISIPRTDAVIDTVREVAKESGNDPSAHGRARRRLHRRLLRSQAVRAAACPAP